MLSLAIPLMDGMLDKRYDKYNHRNLSAVVNDGIYRSRNSRK